MDESTIVDRHDGEGDAEGVRFPTPIRSEKYRTPVGPERELGFWVDRIGAGTGGTGDNQLRILGLYAAVTIVSGEGMFYSARSRPVEVTREDVFVAFPEVMSGYNPRKTGWDTRFIVWGGPEAACLERTGLLDPAAPVVRGAAAAVLCAYEKLDGLMEDWGPVAALTRRIVIEEMVCSLASGKFGMDISTKDSRVACVVKHIRRNLSKPIQVSDLATLVSLSETHLRRLFSMEIGCGMKEFQLAERMNLAKDALAKGDPVKEVAPAIGYPDELYFRRLFRQKVGMTPREFVSRVHYPLPILEGDHT